MKNHFYLIIFTVLSYLASNVAFATDMTCKINMITSDAVAAKSGAVFNIHGGGLDYASGVVLNKISAIEVPCPSDDWRTYYISATPLNGNGITKMGVGKYEYKDRYIEIKYPSSVIIVFPGDFPRAPQK